MNRNWLFVFIAALFEIAWVSGLKHADSVLTWIGTILAILISMDLLIRSSRQLPVGTVYAVFTGLGTAGTVLMEMMVFGEPFRIIKILLILLLVGGVIGLKMTTSAAPEKPASARASDKSAAKEVR